ncbi:MAG: hypothetical protein RSB61_05940, partial [Clostridia bacterium]
ISLLQSICNDGKTVVLVTHNIDDAKKTDLMVEIKDGVIASIIENSLEVKMAAQRASDYDSDGNYIGSQEKIKDTENAEKAKESDSDGNDCSQEKAKVEKGE